MSIENLKKISEKLSKIPSVCRHDTQEEPQCWALAHLLTEFKQSSEKINNEYVAQILKENDSEKIADLLLEIGEEIRFIDYLIQNSKFFSYLVYGKTGDI